MSSLLTKKNLAAFLVLGIMVLSIPFGMNLLQQRQEIRSKAAEISPTPTQKLGPCNFAPSPENCVFDSRYNFILDKNNPNKWTDSITAYGRFWNWEVEGSSMTPWPGNGTDGHLLSSIPRYAEGPCAANPNKSQPCKFDNHYQTPPTLPDYDDVEVVMAYGRFWNWNRKENVFTPWSSNDPDSDGVPQGTSLSTVNRFVGNELNDGSRCVNTPGLGTCGNNKNGPCSSALAAGTLCEIDTVYSFKMTGTHPPGYIFTESITAYGKYWNWDWFENNRYTPWPNNGGSIEGANRYMGNEHLDANPSGLRCVNGTGGLGACNSTPSGPCSESVRPDSEKGKPCKFDTRVMIPVNDGTTAYIESITAYGKYWNWNWYQNPDGTSNTYSPWTANGAFLYSVPNYYQVPLPTATTAPSATEEPIPAPQAESQFNNLTFTLTSAYDAFPGRVTACPAVLRTGEQAEVSVQMANTGAATWTKGSFYLGSTTSSDSTSIGVDSDVAGPSSAPKNFRFSITAPSTSGTYDYQWQMFQNGARFGQPTPNCRVTVLLNCDSSGPNKSSDGVINVSDFEEWKAEFNGVSSRIDADCDYNKRLDLLDFNIWRNIYYTLSEIPKS